MKVKNKTEESAEVAALPKTHLPLELIVENPKVGKRDLDKEHAAELKESIRRHGLDTPLFVWDGGEEYPEMQIGSKNHPSSFLVAGFHRRAALQSLRKEDGKLFDKLFPAGVPVRIFSGKLQDAISLQLRENLDRKNPAAEDILPQVLRLRDEFGLKNKDIARRVGRSDAYISELFSIEKELGSEGVEEVMKGGVSVKNALRAAKEVKAEKKAGQAGDAKGAVERAKDKTATLKSKGGEREEKRKSFKSLYTIYKSLPVMEPKDKLRILEKMCAYVAVETDVLPKELKMNAAKKSKTEPETDEEENEAAED